MAFAAESGSTDINQPGTQPGEVGTWKFLLYVIIVIGARIHQLNQRITGVEHGCLFGLAG
jgi:hypothetical protein